MLQSQKSFQYCWKKNYPFVNIVDRTNLCA
jgi:hypothetical protein